MCVTWHLRQGVRWDDGSDLTSHDVCDTFEFHWLAYGALGKPSPTPLASTAGWNQVIKCTELDRYTAVVDFKIAVRTVPRARAAASTASCPPRCSTRSLAVGGNLESSPASFDLTKGSGNAAAFKGTATLGTVLDGTGPFVMSSDTPGIAGGAGAQSRLLEPERPSPTSTRSSSGSSPTSPPRRRTCAPARSQVGLNLGLAALPGAAGCGARAHGSAHRQPGGGFGSRGAHVQPLRGGRRAVRQPASRRRTRTPRT